MFLKMVEGFTEYRAKFNIPSLIWQITASDINTLDMKYRIQTSHLLCTGDSIFCRCVVGTVDLHTKWWSCFTEPESAIDDGHFGLHSEF